MDRREDGKEVGNVGSERESVCSTMRQDGNCKDKSEPGNNNGENRLLKLNKD
jgi:hypothetical protein